MLVRLPIVVAVIILAIVALSPFAQAKPQVVPPADKFMFIAYGDTRSYADDHRKVISAIVRLHPEFVIQSGDLVSKGSDKLQWDEFEDITKPLIDDHIGYYPARGNHDVGPYFLGYVPKPVESGNGYYYAFSKHGSRFIFADGMDADGYDPDSPQYKWLQNELASAAKTATHTFVMFHQGPFSVGLHGPTANAAKYIHPLFVKYHPTAVFCGHDHLYYHTVRDGVPYFVTGGGGAPLYDPINAALAIPGDVYASVHHIIVCEVDGKNVTFTTLALDKDPTLAPNWHIKSDKPVVTVVGNHGTKDTEIRPTPGGTVIDKATLGG